MSQIPNTEYRIPSKKGNLFLIGLGLSANSLTAEALDALKKSDKIYLENYTVNFPYKISDLEKNYKIKIHPLSRKQVESEKILEEAKTKNISLLIYGDPLSATTHTQFLISNTQTLAHSHTHTLKHSHTHTLAHSNTQTLKHSNTRTLKHCETHIYHNASILTAVSQTGLSLYKFGKTTSMPNWKEHTNKPTSYIKIIKQNQSIQAHTLILTDINLSFPNAIKQLQKSAEKENLKLPKKIIIISNAGTNKQKIHIMPPTSRQLPTVSTPFCLIIPSSLNHIEKKALNLITLSQQSI